jgi:type II secretory pathway pseudopilin PulG
MLNRNRQSGITLIGFVIVLAVVGFFAYCAMKLIPAYTEYFGVVKSMKAVVSQSNASEMSLEDARRAMSLNFSVQYVDDASVPPAAIKIDTANGARRLHVIYDKQIPFMYNIDLLLHFDHTEDLLHGSAS